MMIGFIFLSTKLLIRINSSLGIIFIYSSYRYVCSFSIKQFRTYLSLLADSSYYKPFIVQIIYCRY
jgi:hypothetical protein